MEIKITLNKELLNDKDMDFFHYNGEYELAKCDYGKFYIVSRGELKCDYFDDNGVWVDNAINTIQNWYVRNNDEYIKATNNGNLVLDMNNWFEIDFITNNGKYVCLTDDVFGSISECLTTFEELIKDNELMKEFEKDIKESE